MGRKIKMLLKGHTINPGYAEGEAVVTHTPFSFSGELDPNTGKIAPVDHELCGQLIKGKIFVVPTGKGSSSGPNVAWAAMKAGNAPCGIICVTAEPVLAAGAITANIPMIDRLEQNPLEVIKTGDYVKLDALNGLVEIVQ